jgi:hypothetical protein
LLGVGDAFEEIAETRSGQSLEAAE